MPDFTVRSDTVNVEQIMEQIRARILEKRGADYTEQQIHEMAAVKLEKFLDPRGLRSDLLEQFRKQQRDEPPAAPNYAFEDSTLYESHRAPLRWIRRILQPILKLFFNPNPLIQALHIQSRVNALHQERDTARRGLEQLQFEVLHNLVVETTRLNIELKNLKMRVESLTSRLEFNERRARALESVVVYKPADADLVTLAAPEPEAAAVEERAPVGTAAVPPAVDAAGPGQRSRRRRRRRGRKGGAPAASLMAPGVAGTGISQTDTESGPDGDQGTEEEGTSPSGPREHADTASGDTAGDNEPSQGGTDREP